MTSKNYYKTIKTCEVCNDRQLLPVLDLGEHPMCDDLVPVGSTRQQPEYPISILWCKKCTTAHQKYQVPKRTLFPPNYHYRARFTRDVLLGMRDLVTECQSRLDNLKGLRVLDVGCNDGSLLDIFREMGAETIGIEPTNAAGEARQKGHKIIHDFFNPSTAAKIVRELGSPDVVTFTNVFAHIEDLEKLLEAVRIVMANNATLVIENHYLGSIIEKAQFDTFYHEHPRTYSLNSFLHIARRLDLSINKVSFPNRYGGNIRVFISSRKSEQSVESLVENIILSEADFLKQLSNLDSRISRWRARKREQIISLVEEYGPLSAKSFPGRASILLRLLELDEAHIAAVYEKPGSLKIGNYVPGTKIPIVSDDGKLFGSAVIINLAWHIGSEIRAYLAENGFVGQVVDIIDLADL